MNLHEALGLPVVKATLHANGRFTYVLPTAPSFRKVHVDFTTPGFIKPRKHYFQPRDVQPLPIHRTEAGYPNCSTCDGGGCYDCTDPA